MKKTILTWAVILLGLAAIGAEISIAARGFRAVDRRQPFTGPSATQNMRSISSDASDAAYYDTLNFCVGSACTLSVLQTGARTVLNSVTIFGDDSAVAGTVRVRFINAINRNTYLSLAKTFAANEISATTWSGINFAFPYDTTVVMHTYIPTATMAMDTVNVSATYEIEGRN